MFGIRISFEENKPKKNREFKGTSFNSHIDNYCVVDLETTSRIIGFADIIEISALKVRDNQVVDEYSTLVNPNYHIPDDATMINHITDDMVKNAPPLNSVIDSFLSFIKDDVIVGYNNAGFDMNLIYDSVEKLRGLPFSNNYLDVYHAAKRSIDTNDLANYQLATVSTFFGLNTEGEHRALKDCYLTKCCYDKIFETFGNDAFKKRGNSNSFSKRTKGKGIEHSQSTIAHRELWELVDKMLQNKEITNDDIDYLWSWIEEHKNLSNKFPFSKVFDAFNNVLENGMLSQTEFNDLLLAIKDPVKFYSYHGVISSLKNKHVYLSGNFEFGQKSSVKELIEKAGGFVEKSVIKALDYLVVGELGSQAWTIEGRYGDKIRQAIDYNDKGSNIRIVEENDFIPKIQYLIEHLDEKDESFELLTVSEQYNNEWKDSVQTMLNQMINEKDLPNQSLCIIPNYDSEGSRITSYSICIYEPDYPPNPYAKNELTRNSIVLKVKELKNQLELMIANSVFDKVGIIPDGAEIKPMKSDSVFTHILVPINIDLILSYIKIVTEFELANYISKAAPFGCCSRFIECSNVKHCIHENKLYSKACMYRSNLEADCIFYGKNRNVE